MLTEWLREVKSDVADDLWWEKKQSLPEQLEKGGPQGAKQTPRVGRNPANAA